MNPSSKRYLLTLGPLVCLAISLLCITEYWIRNSKIQANSELQAEVIANRLIVNLQDALKIGNTAKLERTIATEFINSDLAAVLLWSPDREHLQYGIKLEGESFIQLQEPPIEAHMVKKSFTIHSHESPPESLGSFDIYIDLTGYKERQLQALISTALETATIAFPLIIIALYILNQLEKRQVKELRESIIESTRQERTNSQNILEGTEAGTWDWNLQTNELTLNDRWAEIIGYRLKELAPVTIKTWESSVHPGDLPKAQQLVEQHLSGVIKYYDIEFRQRHKDGSWRWINARGKVTQWSEDKVPLRMSGTHLDITERKVAEEANQASHQLLQTVFDATSGVSVIATDKHGIITLFNSGAERMLGYTAKEMVGQKTPFILHLKSELEERGVPIKNVIDPTPETYMEQILQVGQENPEWTYIRKDGSRLPVKLSITTTRDETGNITGYLGAAMDLSDRKQVEVKLNESKLILQKVLDTIPVRVFWKDRNSVYLGGNKLFCEDAGRSTPKELVGLTDHDLAWPNNADAFRADDAEVMQTNHAKLNFEEPQSRPDGSLSWLKTSKIPLRDEDGQVIGVLGTYEDITVIKKAKEDLVTAKEAAEAASRAKDEFLAVMSHEMRTPLNPILGFADMLRISITTKPESEYIETIINAANRQLRLIDDILEYMRINSGKIKPNMEPFNLIDLCELAVSDAQATMGSLEFRFEPSKDDFGHIDDLTVISDLMMVRRILDNLLNNACKYTHEGHVSLSLKRSPEQSNGFTIAISDSGVGIDKVDQEKLFDAFSQADSSYTRKHEGLGLGLAITKKLLSILGGTIDVESQLGVGSTFTIQLPLKEIDERRSANSEYDTSPSKHPTFQQPYSVLIVDDQADNRLIARTIIQSFGGKVTEAINGQEAVDLCHKHKFEVILMDLAMPVMGGKEATRQICNTINLNQTTPIVAVTADVTPQVKDTCAEAGIKHYMSKPINAHSLFELIETVV